MDGGSDNTSSHASTSQGPSTDYCHLMTELKAQSFDVMRFSSYRTACKLRFIQNRLKLNSVNIWNIIEAFRENNLNTMEPRMEISSAHLETVITSLYFQLNKRLPSTQHIELEQCSSLLLSWLISAYNSNDDGKLRIFSVKVALAAMCSGKLMDKLRYIFSLLCDASGHLIQSKFADFLKEILQIPCSVHESPTFGYKDSLPTSIFDGQSKVTVNDFLDVLMSDPGPACLVWLPLLHRLVSVENVLHPVQCDGCNREAFLGFRYKCQRCYNYQLCQDCFWRGRISGSHTNSHEMKEYTYYKSPSKQLGHSLKKSFRCIPDKQISSIPRFPEEPERTLNLQHIVPPSPMPLHNGFFENGSYSCDISSLDSRSTTRSCDSNRGGDDEHRLIARYAARLADNRASVRSPSDLSLNMDTSKQHELIAELESKNREIMQEIMLLRRQQEQEIALEGSEQNPTLLSELRALRQRKEELETHLSTLQESRKELMVQLEALMKMLKNHQPSPQSTPNSSPQLSAASKSPPLSTPYPLSTSRSVATTPDSNAPASISLGSHEDDTFDHHNERSTQKLRNDLLVTADSVTNAMSSLVRELNCELELKDDGSTAGSIDDSEVLWQQKHHSAAQQDAKFLAEIEAKKCFSSHLTYLNREEAELQNNKHDSNDDSSKDTDQFHHSTITTDDESYVRTDEDEDGGNVDWEETMHLWINR